MEESKRSLDDSQNTSLSDNSDPCSAQSVDLQPPATPATPDYAAGLTALNPPTPSLVIANNRSPIHASSTPQHQPNTPYSQPVTTYFQSSPQQPRTPQTPLYTPVIMGSNGIVIFMYLFEFFIYIESVNK